MNIAICFHPINDLGGIINHTEQLAYGFQELGHETDLLWFYYQENCVTQRKTDDNTTWDTGSGAFGLPYNQKRGWLLGADNKIPYKGPANIAKAKKRLSRYDLVIWTIPVPTKQKQNGGNDKWPELYQINPNQIIIAHDANIARSTPWVLKVKKYLKGAACVHEASYNTTKLLGLPRALIYNPQDLSKVCRNIKYKSRNGWLSVQVFKKIKRIEELLAAIPHMGSMNKFLAGGGMEYHYMTSKDKCKPEYKGLWKNAVRNGMDYLGFITNDYRDKLLREVVAIIDPSWDKHYSTYGGHFNRTIIEGIMQGAVPIARDLGMSSDKSGINKLFTPDKNYIMIPYNATPKTFAEIVTDVCYDKKTYDLITRNNTEFILPKFDRKRIAKKYLKLAANGGVHKEPDPVIKAKSDEMCSSFFGMKGGRGWI